MLFCAFDIKVFLSDYGFAFAIAAAALLIILIAVVVCTAVKISKLKRENKILARQANLAGQLLVTADKPQNAAYAPKSSAENAADKQPPEKQSAAKTQPAPQSAAKTQPASNTPSSAVAKPSDGGAKCSDSDDSDVEIMDENSRVKYTVKYDRAKLNWIIVKEGNERPTRRVATKSEAMSIARELSKKHDAALSVHKMDGKFQKH